MTSAAPARSEGARAISDSPAELLPAFPAHRIIGLADGVFAIALTLLVLELRVPASAALDMAGRHQTLLHELPELGRSLLWYVVTGLAVGRYWVMHSRLFHTPHRPGRNVAHLNVALLLSVSLLPFTASLMTRYPEDGVALMIYAGVQALINLEFLLLLRAVPSEGRYLWSVLRINTSASLVVDAAVTLLAPWTPVLATALLPLSVLIRWQVTPRWMRRDVRAKKQEVGA